MSAKITSITVTGRRNLSVMFQGSSLELGATAEVDDGTSAVEAVEKLKKWVGAHLDAWEAAEIPRLADIGAEANRYKERL